MSMIKWCGMLAIAALAGCASLPYDKARKELAPQGKRAAHAYVTRFIEDGKTDGTLRRALDAAGFGDLAVAPPEPYRSSR